MTGWKFLGFSYHSQIIQQSNLIIPNIEDQAHISPRLLSLSLDEVKELLCSFMAELALVLISPAGRPPVRNSSEIGGKEQNLLSKSCRSTQTKQNNQRNFDQMEEDLHGRSP